VSAHASRLHRGWPRAYPRSLAVWAFFVKVDYCRRPPGGSNKEQNV